MKKGKSHFRLPSLDGQPVIQALKAGPLLSSLPVRTGKYRHAPAVLAAGRHHYCDQRTCPACPAARTGTLPACLIRAALYCLQSWRFERLQSQHLRGLQGSDLWRLLSRLFERLQDQISGSCSYGPFNARRACFYPQDSACICPRSGFITGRPVLL